MKAIVCAPIQSVNYRKRERKRKEEGALTRAEVLMQTTDFWQQPQAPTLCPAAARASKHVPFV